MKITPIPLTFCKRHPFRLAFRRGFCRECDWKLMWETAKKKAQEMIDTDQAMFVCRCMDDDCPECNPMKDTPHET